MVEVKEWNDIPRKMVVWNDGYDPELRHVEYYAPCVSQWMTKVDGRLVGYQHAAETDDIAMIKNPFSKTNEPDDAFIYVIQVRVVETKKKKGNDGKFHKVDCVTSERNIGWRKTYEMAYLELVRNSDVISDDGYYNYALIERVHFGSYGGANPDWYGVQMFKLSKLGEEDRKKTGCDSDYVYVPASELKRDGVIGYTIG